MLTKWLMIISLGLVAIAFSCKRSSVLINISDNPEKTTKNDLVALGKGLFFDESLSNPAGQSCASCHAPDQAFSDPGGTSFSEGVLSLSGNRNAPSVSYAAYSPTFFYDKKEETYIGGQFWDGRAADLCEQAKNPLLNHAEMNNRDKKMVIAAVKRGKNKDLFLKVYGEKAFSDADLAFEYLAKAIEAYEQSIEINPFSSKFDAYLKGEITLTKEEQQGLKLFNDPKKGNCAACHPSTPDPATKRVLFTDYTYDNLGVPGSENTSKTAGFKADLGLGAIVKEPSENGKFKVPTLRNVALTAPYFHNGSFEQLEDVVEFYNSRDKGTFGKPEIAENVNHDELGNLNLTKDEVKAITTFLKTLTDGYSAKSNR
ncbi:MAG: cytochrome c peroxidase [Bacteroidota bacterium]